MARINWGRLFLGSLIAAIHLIVSIVATIAGAALYRDAATPATA